VAVRSREAFAGAKCPGRLFVFEIGTPVEANGGSEGAVSAFQVSLVASVLPLDNQRLEAINVDLDLGGIEEVAGVDAAEVAGVSGSDEGWLQMSAQDADIGIQGGSGVLGQVVRPQQVDNAIL